MFRRYIMIHIYQKEHTIVSQSGPTANLILSLLEEFDVEQIKRFSAIASQVNERIDSHTELKEFDQVRYSLFKSITDTFNLEGYQTLIATIDRHANVDFTNSSINGEQTLLLAYPHYQNHQAQHPKNSYGTVEEKAIKLPLRKKQTFCCIPF